MGSFYEDSVRAHGLTTVCSLTLRTPDGREQTMAAYIPNDDIRRHYISKAAQAGLAIEIKNIDNKH